MLEKLLCPDRFFDFISRRDVNWIRIPASKKDAIVGIIPIVLKTKGKDKIPTPMTVFMSIVTDRRRPLYDIIYLPFYERMRLTKPKHSSQHFNPHSVLQVISIHPLNFNCKEVICNRLHIQ